MKKKKFFMVVIILIMIDQITKFLIELNIAKLPKNLIRGILEIVYCQNEGIAFGIGQGTAQIFSVITLIIIIGIIFIICKNYNKISGKMLLGVALLIAGGIGNLIDRIFRMYVVDFIYFKCINFPVFNFADVYIVTGITIIGILYIVIDRGEKFEENNC